MFAPVGGKKLVAFIDDLNMPAKSPFGFLPPLELLKLWVDNGFWYDRQKCEVKHVKDMQLLAAMAPPGGGRNAFSQRVGACFTTLNVTAPNDAQLKRIFGTILNAKVGGGSWEGGVTQGLELRVLCCSSSRWRCSSIGSKSARLQDVAPYARTLTPPPAPPQLADFDDEVKPVSDPLTLATIAIYRVVAKELLPTPSKSHYLFNTRDLAKIIQGMMQATKTYYNSKDEVRGGQEAGARVMSMPCH